MFDWLFFPTKHDNKCMKKIELYYKTCTNESRIHNSYSIKHLCQEEFSNSKELPILDLVQMNKGEEFTDYYLKGCVQKEVDLITKRIKYIPNKAQYDPYYDIKRFIGEY
jgi:hypothetical protein